MNIAPIIVSPCKQPEKYLLHCTNSVFMVVFTVIYQYFFFVRFMIISSSLRSCSHSSFRLQHFIHSNSHIYSFIRVCFIALCRSTTSFLLIRRPYTQRKRKRSGTVCFYVYCCLLFSFPGRFPVNHSNM